MPTETPPNLLEQAESIRQILADRGELPPGTSVKDIVTVIEKTRTGGAKPETPGQNLSKQEAPAAETIEKKPVEGVFPNPDMDAAVATGIAAQASEAELVEIVLKNLNDNTGNRK